MAAASRWAQGPPHHGPDRPEAVLIDTHCHLGDPAFAPDRRETVERMRAAGVGRALVIESRLGELETTLRWAAAEPGFAVATGCHPHGAAAWNDAMRQQVIRAWHRPEVAAAGEIGLDYHYDHSPRDVQ